MKCIRKPPEKKYSTNKITYNRTVEIWNLELADFSDHKISNKKWLGYTFVIFENFPKHTSGIAWKIKNSHKITDEFSNDSSTSKRKPVNWKVIVVRNFTIVFFKTSWKVKKLDHFFCFFDKCPSIAEQLIPTIRNLLKKPVFEKGNLIYHQSLQNYNNTIHSSTKRTHTNRSLYESKWKASLSKSPRP